MTESSLTSKESNVNDDDESIIIKNIDNLKDYLKQTNNESIKLIECTGDLSYLIKFFKFNEYSLNITVKIPCKYK
jgi:hypothetical protein